MKKYGHDNEVARPRDIAGLRISDLPIPNDEAVAAYWMVCWKGRVKTSAFSCLVLSAAY